MANEKNVVQNGSIIPNLRADIMRKAMQPKGALSHKGGIYVGTGTTDPTVQGYQIYQTVEVYPNNVLDGTPLVTDINETGGLKFGSISGSLIQDGTLNVSKLASNAAENTVLKSNGAGQPPSFQVFTADMITSNTLDASKLTTNICDTNPKSSEDQVISLSLSQDTTTHKIRINSVSLDYAKMSPYINSDTSGKYLKKFTVSNGILYIG